jgi:hypothetical protein
MKKNYSIKNRDAEHNEAEGNLLIGGGPPNKNPFDSHIEPHLRKVKKDL